MHKTLLAAAIALTVSAGSLAAAPAAYKEPLDAQTLDTIKSEFGKLMELANRHDLHALHDMFSFPAVSGEGSCPISQGIVICYDATGVAISTQIFPRIK